MLLPGPRTTSVRVWTDDAEQFACALAMACQCKHAGNFSHQSDAAGIPGGWSGDSDDPNRKYLRVLRDIDCSSEDQRKKFTDMVGDGVTVVGVI